MYSAKNKLSTTNQRFSGREYVTDADRINWQNPKPIKRTVDKLKRVSETVIRCKRVSVYK